MSRPQHPLEFTPPPSYYEPDPERESLEERQARLDKEGDDAYEDEIERKREQRRKIDMAKTIEDSAIEKWINFGIECFVIPGSVSLNGYIRLPEALKGIDIDQIEAHGGITSGPTESGLIGFDTAHDGDVWDRKVLEKHCGSSALAFHDVVAAGGVDITWDLERLKAEVTRLSARVAQAAMRAGPMPARERGEER